MFKSNEVLEKILLCISAFKSALLGLKQFFPAEIPLKMMKNGFYFTLKALFVLKIFKLLSNLFGNVEKQLDKTSQPG